jgi:hypothetical protein
MVFSVSEYLLVLSQVYRLKVIKCKCKWSYAVGG